MDTLFKFITKIYSQKYFPIFATTMLVLFTTLSLNGLLSEKVITIEQEGITLRVGAATNSSAVKTLSEGDRVEIMGERNGWYNVRVNGNQTGYIPSWLLSNSQLTSDQSLAAHLKEPLVLRQNATEDSKEVARIPADKYVHVNFENNGWLQVEYGEQYGYIQTKDVELLSKANIPNPSRENLAENNSYSDESLVEDSDTEIVYVRQGNQAFLQSPDYASDIFYHPSYNQEFLYISEHNVDDEYSFYYVEDDEGTRGYIDKRYAALKSDYAGHVDTTDATSIAEATIIIDAGHGGMDPGTMSLDEQYFEKDYTLPTALYLQQELEALGATVIMTRTSDEFV